MTSDQEYCNDLDCNILFKHPGEPHGYPEHFTKSNPANPKTLVGRLKVPNLSVVPPTALIYLGTGMADGARKYGPYNWRDQPIEAGVYLDAAIRHLMCWQDGEENAQDSGVHHLAHAMATIGILADAMENGTMIDTRPKANKQTATRLLEEMKKHD